MSLTVSLSANPRLLHQFPNDPFADVTIQHHNKTYKLQKAHLRVETCFFDDASSQVHIDKLIDAQVLEQLLRCFYGGHYELVKSSEIYLAYQTAAYLQIESIVKQIEIGLLKNLAQFNFTTVYQLAYVYHLDDLKDKCLQHLQASDFKNVFDLASLDLHSLNKFPTNLISLDEAPFKSLLKVYLAATANHLHAFRILKLYVASRTQQDTATEKDYLRYLVIQLIPKDKLTHQQYLQIYHSELLLASSIQDSMILSEPGIQQLNDTCIKKNTKSQSKFEIQRQGESFLTSKIRESEKMQISQNFDPILSENYLQKREIEELRRQNAELLRRMEELTMKSEFQWKIESSFNELDQRVEERISYLEQDLYKVKAELEEKKEEVGKKEMTIQELESQLKELLVTNTQKLEEMDEREDDEEREDAMEDSCRDSRVQIYRIDESEVQESGIMVEMSQSTQIFNASEVQMAESELIEQEAEKTQQKQKQVKSHHKQNQSSLMVSTVKRLVTLLTTRQALQLHPRAGHLRAADRHGVPDERDAHQHLPAGRDEAALLGVARRVQLRGIPEQLLRAGEGVRVHPVVGLRQVVRGVLRGDAGEGGGEGVHVLGGLEGGGVLRGGGERVRGERDDRAEGPAADRGGVLSGGLQPGREEVLRGEELPGGGDGGV